MNLRLSFAALALMLAPGLALASPCSDKQAIKTTASACAEGQIWDATTRGCVAKPTS